MKNYEFHSFYKDTSQPALGTYMQAVSKLTGVPAVGSFIPLPDESEFLVTVRGRSIKASITGTQSKSGGGRRGRVSSFSAESRNRLLHLLNSVLQPPNEFLTLTYPADFPETQVTKDHLDVFLKRIDRAFPGTTIVWKLEYQQRGAPHYHCCVWFTRPYNWEFWIDWVSRNWYEVVGSGDEKHLRAGTNTEPPQGPWNRYLSKYVSKDSVPMGFIRGGADGSQFVMYTSERTGRFWGVFNRKIFNSLQDAELRYSINPKSWRNVRKWLNRITGRKTNRRTCSFLIDSEYTAMQIAFYCQEAPQLYKTYGVYLAPSFGPKNGYKSAKPT